MTHQPDLFRPDELGYGPTLAMFEHLSQVEADAVSDAIRMQLSLWRMWNEQLALGLNLAHTLMVSEAMPDPMTDRALWWSMKTAAL